MWYDDILMISMGFIVLLMIVMTIIMMMRLRKQPVKIEVEEPQPEKILVEKGFENNIKEESIEPEEAHNDMPAYIEEQVTPVMDEPPAEQTQREPTPQEPEIVEPVLLEPEQTQEEPQLDESLPRQEELELPSDETVEITPIKPIIIEPPEIEEKEESNAFEPRDIPEPNDDVVITPNQTFYDSAIVEPEETIAPNLDESPSLDEEEREPVLPEEPEMEEIPEIELPQLESEEPKEFPEEIGAEIEELESDLVIPVIPEKPISTRRVRKPVIDESNPDLKLDLGIEKCPHCGSRVPATIYCINCGKVLDLERAAQEEEEN